MEQKHFMDIERAKFSTELKNGNTDGFQVGDHIVIQEKVDGSNGSICYDIETGKLVAFSRKQELNYMNTLEGFWNWVQELDPNKFSVYPDYVFFGEWLRKNKITYRQDAYKKFYFYDVYDKDNRCYLPQNEVKRLATELDLEYVHTLYDGPFISWEHCKSFCNSPAYGDRQEGCFDFRAKILMADNSLKQINKIKIGEYVKSYNEQTNEIENKKVLNVYNNGMKPLNEWYSIAVFPKGISGNKNITGRFHCTRNHNFFDGKTYTKIDNLDYVYHYGIVFDDFRKQAFLGLMLSDMTYHKEIKAFSLTQLTTKTMYIRKLFENFITKNKRIQISGKGSVIENICFKKQLCKQIVDEYITDDNEVNWKKAFSDLNEIGWCYFFIGDGCGKKNGTFDICLASYSLEEVEHIVYCFKNIFGINSGSIRIDKRVMNGSGASYTTSASDGKMIMKRISKYIPDEFRYKIKALGKDSDDLIPLPPIKYGLVKRYIYSKINAEELKTNKFHKNFRAYDLEIEDNHNYFVNGCLVHNCVIKNQSKLNTEYIKLPFVIKIVNEDFAEVKGEKIIDPIKVAEQDKARQIVEMIVTKNRVEKQILKMRDEGILPEKIEPSDMKTIAKFLPKRVYDDCVKEEEEYVIDAGEYFGKMCGAATMKLAREIILG